MTKNPNLNNIKKKNILKKFIKFKKLFFLNDILKKYPETHLQHLHAEIYKKTIQLIKTHNKNHINTILHFSTNIIYFFILNNYSILNNQKLILINSLIQKFIYNLNNTIKTFSILLLTNLYIKFHSTHN
ncbi:hypothetical protein E2H86_25595 [Pseudomonas putida]|nr:hypothetical protein E2H86_25595 [Pseudomonas putida]